MINGLRVTTLFVCVVLLSLGFSLLDFEARASGPVSRIFDEIAQLRRATKSSVPKPFASLSEYHGYASLLLNYWRDAAIHGHASGVNENEAYTAIALLLRFAMFTDDNWEELRSS